LISEVVTNFNSNAVIHGCPCPKVLIVDDEPFNLIALEGLLQSFGVKSAAKAYNGKDALAKLEQNYQRQCSSFNHQGYRLVILDNNMPVMNGIEAASRIRNLQRLGKLL
jgi:CheY-like chemotaxis protein